MSSLILTISILIAFLTIHLATVTSSCSPKTPTRRMLKQTGDNHLSCNDDEISLDEKASSEYDKQVIEYELVKPQLRRIRRPVHKVSPEYVTKFREAIKKMKALPDDDPRSFMNQAKVHSVYCDHPEELLPIHNSWHFFPFHRWYLYFIERILGEMIGDETFALPYWNWDNPTGMEIPQIFEDDGNDNPFYDRYRNPNTLRQAVVDLDYQGTDRNVSRLEQININLFLMNRQMIRNAPDSDSFFGGHAIVGDDDSPSVSTTIGSIESGCHTGVHLWVGDPRTPSNEDMGNLGSAGYDPLFYVHHANVDRMWTLWKSSDENHHEPNDDAWLNASYVFHNEKGDPVRVYNKDSVNLDNLGYEYEVSDTPWNKYPPKSCCKNSGIITQFKTKEKTVDEMKLDINPLKIDKIVKVLVARPLNRTRVVAKLSKEMLLIEKVKYNVKKLVKFNVIVNECVDLTQITASESEYAGSFTEIPQNHSEESFAESGMKLGLSELMKETDDNEDYVLVTIVPITGCDDVVISSIRIEMTDIMSNL